jgi:fido (protein-threonine AMPylation protein)
MKLTYIPGQTPLDPNEIDGLIPQHIALQRELNEFEQQNITKAAAKYLSPGIKINLADPLVIRRIHREMFDDTWAWAGQFRTTIKSIGVFPEKISEELKRCCDDLAYWLQNLWLP